MIDLASVHYLGWLHPSRGFPAWQQFSRGLPAAMHEHPASLQAAAQLARLQGCQDALLAPSTLHLFWDLFGGAVRRALFGERLAIYLDSGAYPIAGWGVERAAANGAQVQRFQRHDPLALQRLLHRRPAGLRPVVVCDGVSACCGQAAPLRDYLQALPPEGMLVVDDTQALGLLGSHPNPAQPYGMGGGGSLRHHNLQDERILLVTSLAKGFGAPLAALSGSREKLAIFRRTSLTRLHCSPPSIPAALTARQALALNSRLGDRTRSCLVGLVRIFRNELLHRGLTPQPGLFPVQSLPLPQRAPVATIQQRIDQAGLQAVFRRCPDRAAPCISFVITARHTPAELSYAAQALSAVLAEVPGLTEFPAPGDMVR